MAYPPILQRLLDLLARINELLSGGGDDTPLITLSQWEQTFLCQVPLPFLVNEAPSGWVPATGTLIEGAADRFPKAWARLQRSDMQHLLCSEADWQAASTQVYYTDAAGNKYSWDGVGGVCKYVQNLDTGTLRMMDLRGLHQEAAGYNTLAVGGVAHDMMRQVRGAVSSMPSDCTASTGPSATGSLYYDTPNSSEKVYAVSGSAKQTYGRNFSLLVSRVAPTGPRTAPARYGVLPCVYLGA